MVEDDKTLINIITEGLRAATPHLFSRIADYFSGLSPQEDRPHIVCAHFRSLPEPVTRGQRPDMAGSP